MEEMLFIKNFPIGVEIPESLIELFRFQEAGNKKYSGHFVLYDSFWKQPPIFPPDIQSKLVFFGLDADGSIYSFWRYNNFPLEVAPIVFIASEWEGNTIVANSIAEFIGLLALGIDELGNAISQPGWENNISTSPETINFRSWLKDELNILIPQEPAEIIQRARNSHPDFNLWLESTMGFSSEEKK